MSDFLPPDAPPPPSGPANPPSGGGFGGTPPSGGGGFGPSGSDGGFGGTPPSGGGFGPPGSGGFGGQPPPSGGGFGGPSGGGVQPAPPPPSQGMSSSTKGCLIAFAVVFGLMALCTCTGLGLAAYGVYSNPEARRAFGAMGDVFTLVQEGMEDPGAQAMTGAGCQQAMAFPLERLFEIMRQVDPDEAPEDPGPDAPEWIVTCTLSSGATKTCDELAQTFATGHGAPTRSFALTVQSWPGNEQVCANLYGPAGELIRPLSEAEQYDVPTAPPPQGAPGGGLPLPPASPK